MPAIEPDLFHRIAPHEEPYVAFLNDLFYEGAKRHAADVHMLWESRETTIHFGVSGALQHFATVPNEFAKHLDDKIRARSSISESERQTTVDSRFQLRYSDRTIDCRVSIVPTITGQKIVCRLNDDSESITSLDEIWMTPMNRRIMLDILAEESGIFLVCGPTGSGKSTTLYAGIGYLHDGTRSIYTLENPVEKIIPGITQVNISTHLTFAQGLRAGLRQAPKVMLIGEIRDIETAQIAIQAANTGHLILATVHANNAPAAVTRMLDLGVDPKSLASALRGVLSQRLVETLREDPARAMREATETEVEWMERAGIHHERLLFPVSASPEDFSGRMPVMELLRADERITKAIMSDGGEMPIFNAAMRQVQFETMAQASTRIAAAGFTTLEKAMKLDREAPIAPETKRVGQILVELGYATPEEMFAVAQQQVQMRHEGKVKRFGEILIAEGICTPREVVEAIGYTEGAPEMMRYFVLTGKLKSTLVTEVEQRWRREHVGESLFNLYVELNYLTQEDFNEPSFLHFKGRRLARPAAPVVRTGNATTAAVDAVAV
jgi:general secretion pathway protein E